MPIQLYVRRIVVEQRTKLVITIVLTIFILYSSFYYWLRYEQFLTHYKSYATHLDGNVIYRHRIGPGDFGFPDTGMINLKMVVAKYSFYIFYPLAKLEGSYYNNLR